MGEQITSEAICSLCKDQRPALLDRRRAMLGSSRNTVLSQEAIISVSHGLTMLRTRQQLEEFEDRTLAPYAMRSADSRGRRFAQPEHPYRTAFQRDRDRIIHSAAFRRLEYKTQVFVNHEGDYYRTRLTHTMEVAQITRTVARALGLNEELAEAVVLSHDLGHTPFGHAGEKALNALMEPYGGFDHNAQSLRTVDWIEERYPAYRGLNLTFEVREGIVKHSNFRNRPAAQQFDPSLYPCLEAQIVDLADEIAYLGHDVDDGLKSGMLSREDLEASQLVRTAERAVRASFPDIERRRGGRYQLVICMIDMMVTDLINNIDCELTAPAITSVDDIRRAGRPLASFSAAMAPQVEELKRLMNDKLYHHYRVLRMTQKAGRVLSKLFHAYMAEPAQIPPHITQRIETGGDSTARVIADYIAGMTDRFALDEYRKLFDPDERV